MPDRPHDTHSTRRKPRAGAEAVPAPESAPQQEPKDFEKLLGDARANPEAADPAAAENPAPGVAQAPTAARPQKKAAKEAQPADAQVIAKPILSEAQALALPATAAPVRPAPSTPARTEAGSEAIAPASAPATDASAGNASDPAAEISEGAQSAPVEVQLPADPAPITARDASLSAQSSAPATRVEAAAPAEAKPLPPAPATHADVERAGEILRQVRVQLSPELRSATIQLTPPELGRISIRMRVDGGELHAVVRAEKRETLDALQRHMPELKATLDQLGIHTRQLDLQLGFEQQGARQEWHDAQPAGRPLSQREQEHEAREQQQRLVRTLAARSGGIDTYA